MKIVSTVDYGYRKVVRVVMNPDDPETIHPDGSLHTDAPRTGKDRARVLAYQAEFGRAPASWEWCPDCHYNWDVREYTFTNTELTVATNKWGNPVHDDQNPVGSRARTWDELYQEAEERLGERIDRADAPLEVPPALVPEVELDFELLSPNNPFMEGTLAKQRFLVLRQGVRVGDFVAEGESSTAFALDRDAKYADAQASILVKESELSEARGIVGA